MDVNLESYDHACYVISKAIIRLQRHDQKSSRETDGAVKYEDIVEEFNKRKRKNVEGASPWSLNDWISILAKRGGAKKRFQYCLNLHSSRHILFFRAIQGHFGGIAIDPALQDHVLSPKGFTAYIYHVGNVSEVHSVIGSGLIRWGQSLKRGRQSVFFTYSEPMEDENWKDETSCDLTKPKSVPYKNTRKPHQKTVFLVQFETRSRERIAVLPDKVARNRPLRHTASCLHRESGMHEDEGWAKPKGTLDSESTAGCKIKFANCSTRSPWTGCKNILWPTKRIKNALGNREQHRGLQNSWCTSSAVEQQDTHRKDCQTLDGMSRTSCYLAALPLKIIHTSRQELREFETQNIGFGNWIRMVLSNR